MSAINLLEKIKDPNNIQDAMYANDSYTLMNAFKRDSTVNRLVKLGSKVIPLIEEQLKKSADKTNKITLSCYAYILQEVDLDAAVKILEPYYAKALENPDPFFLQFIAHALRQKMKLRVNPIDPYYTRGELLETLEMIKKEKRSRS